MPLLPGSTLRSVGGQRGACENTTWLNRKVANLGGTHWREEPAVREPSIESAKQSLESGPP
jgi:hypothetical protein